MAKKARDFHFKKFTVTQDKSSHKVGTDGVLLGAWVSLDGAARVLDVGTGTGVIALMIAQRTSGNVRIDAVELQKEEAEEAALNFNRSPWGDRIKVCSSSLQDFKSDNTYDLIVSNPPYFEKSWLPPDEKRSKVRHTDTLPFHDLAVCSKRLLSTHGRLAVILPPTEADIFRGICDSMGLYLTRACHFTTRRQKAVERILMELSQTPLPPTTEELVLYGDDGHWSDRYWELLHEFYLSRK